MVSMNPLLQLPVFVIGILAGLRRIWATDNKTFRISVLKKEFFPSGKQKEEFDEKTKEQKDKYHYLFIHLQLLVVQGIT